MLAAYANRAGSGVKAPRPMDGKSHIWPPYSAKWKQHVMYEMRASIREGNSVSDGFNLVKGRVGEGSNIREGKSVDDGFDRDKNSVGEGSDSMLYEALLARDPYDGQNLLMYAVRWGRENWFLHLVGLIKEQLGFSVLVKQLRACDINGTPLLCLAASCRSKTTCFQTVYDKLLTVLGNAGVAEQVGRNDHMGRNIVMHAARGNHVYVFKRVQDLFDNHHRSTACQIAGQGFPQPHQQASDSFTNVDITGRNVLHHAAEAGCFEVLSYVIHLVNRKGANMTVPDRNGLTPMHHLLRAKYGEPEGREELHIKFEKLWYISKSWMKPRRVRSLPSGIAVTAFTELIHAARGGASTLQVVLDKIRAMKSVKDVRLDDALCVEVAGETGEGQRPSPPELTQWGWGMLLAAATTGGSTEVLKTVMRAIQIGRFEGGGVEDGGGANGEPMENFKKAVNSISSSENSWFGLAVLSGKVDAVLWVYRFIAQHYDPTEVWEHLCGKGGKISPLTCASSSPMKSKHHGVEVLMVVYECLLEAAKARFKSEQQARLKVSEQFTSRTDITGSETSFPGGRGLRRSTPLVGAVLSSNWVLFEEIYDKYEFLTREKWNRDELLEQLKIASGMGSLQGEYQAMHEPKPHVQACLGRSTAKLKAVMWRDLVEAYQRAKNEVSEGTTDLPSWRETLKPLAGRAVKSASRTGAFDDLRELVKEGLPIHDDFIPPLLDSAEDEEEVVEIVTFAVCNASNPLVMAASVSKSLRNAEADRPMHRTRLRSLQKRIDVLTIELLDKLPHTVRGMGMALVDAVVPQHRPGLQRQRRDDLAVLAGYMVVEWILEPRLLNGQTKPRTKQLRAQAGRYDGPEYMDPLQRALDRGSKALDFINSPLVMDYVHVKFACTLPTWTSSSSIPRNINPGFYKYDDYEFQDVLSPINADQQSRADGDETFFDILLRFLQGWDPEDMKPDEDDGEIKETDTDRSTGRVGQQPQPPSTPQPLQQSCIANMTSLSRRMLQFMTPLPHRTALPMLQFSLVGIIGKPDTFFNVPAVRFAFEFLQFLVMLALFCSSLMLQDAKSIPPREVAFYVFMGGTLWREILEFCDGVPARHRRKWGHKNKSFRTDSKKEPIMEGSPARQWMPSKRFFQRRGLKRVASAVTRYLFHDTWNLVDTFTIVTVFLAFLFRVLAMPEYGGAKTPAEFFFAAQFFLAVSAPLLFARLLRLSQIDDTLGPMTQIIWRMLSQTLRFGVFIVVVMAGFGLAFHAVFFLCDAYTDLGENFGTFASALLYVFEAPLGEFDFGVFNNVTEQCPNHPSPGQASDAGIFLLVAYLLVLAIIMLNLLIAVLTTTHGEVHENGEKEFHLARTRLIQQSARAVAYGRVPPPFNLLQLVSGFVVDAVIECIWWGAKLQGFLERSCRRRDVDKIVYAPITSKYGWHTFDGMMQRFAFAFAMGLVAVALNGLLWVFSLPWVTWRFLKWATSKFEDEDEDEDEEENKSTSKTAELGIIQWAQWRKSVQGKVGFGETAHRGYPTAMPGQEHGNNWRYAWEHVAKKQNFRLRHEHESEHFHVAPLLQSTSGLDMERLYFLTKKKQEPSSGEKGAREKFGESDEPDPEAAGGYMFPVQQSGLPSCSSVLDKDFEPKVQSFLKKMRESPRGNVQVPSFPGEGRTDRDGTAVIPPDDENDSGETKPESKENGNDDDHDAGETKQESKESGNDGNELKFELLRRANHGLGIVRAYSGNVEEVKHPSGDVYYTASSGSTATSDEREKASPISARAEKREAEASARPDKEHPRTTEEPVLGISIWAPTLQEGEVYVSDEHGVRVSVPGGRRSEAPQIVAGPVLLERRAEVITCGGDAFFITSIVHCFPSGARFAEPLLLEFEFEVKEGTADVKGAYKVLKREDKFHPWSVLQSTERLLHPGRGRVQATVEHAYQYTLANIYDRSGYHVFRRRHFNLLGVLRNPADSVLKVANNQFGLWNVSGYPLSIFLVLPNTSALPNTTPDKAQRAPIDGAGMPRELGLVQRRESGGSWAVLTSNLGYKAANVYTAWSGKDKEAVLLVATFKDGTAHLWTTRTVQRGVRGLAVAVVDTEYEVSFPVLLPFAFATSQVPTLAELRSITKRSTFPDAARVGVDPRRQLLSKAIALRVESEAQAACLRRAGDLLAEPCGVVAVFASPNLITVHPR
eukprot:g19903.t1